MLEILIIESVVYFRTLQANSESMIQDQHFELKNEEIVFEPKEYEKTIG